MSLRGWIVLTGELKCRTGLHIGGLIETFVVGRADSPVIRGAYYSTPYVPGTALRGKLRSLLERFLYTQGGADPEFFQVLSAGKQQKITLHSCKLSNCPICRLFGNTPLEKEQASEGEVYPGSLHIDNLYPSESKPEPDTKTENALDRVTQAANPRSLERVPAETAFKVRMSYFVRNPDHLAEDMRNLATSIALLQDDHLGGGGSRGSGAVELKINNVVVKWIESTEISEQSYGSLEDLLADVTKAVQPLSVQSPASAPLPSSAASDRQTWIVKLKFRSPLHIGEPGIGVESTSTYIPSDTLFSALCHAWAAALGERSLSELLNHFLGDAAHGHQPPFVLSSAYPYLGERFYLPKPYIPPRPYVKSADDDEEKFEKSPLKDLDFIPIEIFAQWLRDGLEKDVDDQLTKEARELYKEALIPRVRIDRVNHSSNLYFCGVVEYPDDGGLYLLLEGRSDLESQLKTCFELLGELGIGGERAAGCGKFEIRGDWQKAASVPAFQKLIEVRTAESPTAYCTLSLFYPQASELALISNAPVGYALAWRGGGWATLASQGRPQRRQACRMFKEGSVFAFKAGNGSVVQPVGTLVEVASKVYRSGLAFCVPVYRRDLA